jgi:hypothetical protein
MPTNDPTGRRDSRAPEQEQRNLEYLKGVTQGPMGWPATPPTPTYIDPADIERMLNQNPEGRHGPRNPWLNLRNIAIVVILFAALIAVIIALL